MNTTTRKSARLENLNETDRQSVFPTNPHEFCGMISTTTGTGTDHPTQLPEVEPQPLDSSIATGQVEIKHPYPSEAKTHPSLLLILPKKKQSRTPLDQPLQ
jgi:hypothetical protein